MTESHGSVTSLLAAEKKRENDLTIEQGRQLLHEYFDQTSIHSYYTCDHTCRDISEQERQRLRDSKTSQIRSEKQKKRSIEIFRHQWLTDRKSSYCERSGVWWLIYVEGEGMYCLLCRIHNSKNKFNKQSVFNQVPSTNSCKHSAITEHGKNGIHLDTIPCELARRNSSLAQQHREVKETKDQVTFNAFQACYWLAKEETSNTKLLSLINLQKRSGVKEMTHYKNTSARSQQEMRLLTGQLIKNNLLDQIYSAKWFSILVDEVTDCSSIEQLLIYIGFFDMKGESHFKFLDCVDVLADSHSADAATITKCILNECEASQLNTENLCGFGSDGASVMTGEKSGVGVRLQEHAPSMLRSHCINHRLALACGDANDNVKYISVIETTLRQLWKWLEYPKRSAAYVKICTAIHKIELSKLDKKQNRAIATKVQKACRTRWLSTGNSISSVARNFVALMQTLRQFKETDATAHGLLTRMNNVKFLGTVLLLNNILPHLNALSRLFQKDHTCYASIKPSLEYTKAAIQSKREEYDIIQDLEEKISPTGMYSDLEMELSLQNSARGFLTSLQRDYTCALEENLDSRFVEAPILKAFGIFDPTAIPGKLEKEFGEYGNEEILLLSAHFHMPAQQTTAEWQNFRYILVDVQLPDDILKGKGLSPIHFMLKKVVKEQATFRIAFSNIVDLAQICLSQPLSNAVVERGASAVKRVKTRLRNSLKNDMLASLLHITINGPHQVSNFEQLYF